jgi:hypothetical protein
MDKIIYFDNANQRVDRCADEIYHSFLDYAFNEATYFMLVYVNYSGKGYSNAMKEFKVALKSYQVKSRSNPYWPGVQGTYSHKSTYRVVFYKTHPKAKDILKRVSRLSEWSSPHNPQDLAFFKGNQCWFYSVGHEKIAAIIHANEKDLDFVETYGLATRQNAFVPKNDYFDCYNETLE